MKRVYPLINLKKTRDIYATDQNFYPHHLHLCESDKIVNRQKML
jgi:hypothetical protein